jgi:tetratricopeptide (TPR) repeat protein
LAGRQQELAELCRSFDLACQGKGSTILISGEAGCGKTRLAKEFLKAMTSEAIVLSGWCLSKTAIPYFPFIEAFDSNSSIRKEQVEVNEVQNLKLKRWLTRKSEGNESESFNRQAWKDQAFASVTRELLLLSTQNPVVFFIDDVHWADSASLSLLQYLARSITYERILLLATYRSEELSGQYDVQSQSLAEILRVMRRENLYQEIKLTGLGKSEVCSIAECMLSGNVSPKLVDRLTLETSGNPLFVIESLKMLAEQRGLIKENDLWTAVDDQFGVPDKVKDVILRRLNMLNLEARDVLDAGSVVGDKFDAQLISAVLDQSPVKVLSILNSINKTRSLVCCEQDWYRFDHPKTREVLYEEISLPLKKEYHLRVAEKLEALKSGSSAVTFGDLAFHYVHSGNKQKAIKYSLEAGKNALVRFSNAEAIRHFNYVLGTLGDSNVCIETTAALEGLGDAYDANMQLEEAIKTYRNLAALGGPTKVRALRKAMDCAFFQNSHELMRVLLKEVETCEVTDHLERARLLMNKARVTSKTGNLALAIHYFEEALKLAEDEYSQWDVAWILIGLGSSRLWTGPQEKALAELLRAIQIFNDLGDNRWLIEAYNAAGNAFITHFGLRKVGIDFLRKAAEVNDQAKVGDCLRLAQLYGSWGRALAINGDLEGALSKSLDALSFAERTDSDWGRGVVYANLTMFYSALGDIRQAEEYYAKLVGLPVDAQRNVYVGAPTAKACFLALINKWNEVNQIFENMFSTLGSLCVPGVEANARACYAGLLEKQGQTQLALHQKQITQNLFDSISKQLEKANVYFSLMAPVNLLTDQTFEMRIDIVNLSSNPLSIVSISNIVPSEFQATPVLPYVNLEKNITYFENKTIGPFSARSIKLLVQPTKSGSYDLGPQVTYIDKQGSTKVGSIRTVKVIVNSSAMPTIHSGQTMPRPAFKSESAEAIFNFLVKANEQDYLQRKMPKERSGWRTLMDIVNGANVSRYNVYGSSKGGQAIAELQRVGLVEVRVFEGERGRGGKILKVRICENENRQD